MKNWSWKQWTGFALVIAVIIAAVVCHLVQPEVTYAWLEMISCGTFVLGGLSAWLLGRKKTAKQINS